MIDGLRYHWTAMEKAKASGDKTMADFHRREYDKLVAEAEWDDGGWTPFDEDDAREAKVKELERRLNDLEAQRPITSISPRPSATSSQAKTVTTAPSA